MSSAELTSSIPPKLAPGAAVAAGEHPGDQQPEPCQVVGVVTGKVAGDGPQPSQVGLVRIRLAEAEHAVIGVKLDDRPQGIGLVDAYDVEQRWIRKGNWGDLDPRDSGAGHRAGLTASTGTSSSSNSRCASLPITSLPTGLRRRRPITTRRASFSVTSVVKVSTMSAPCSAWSDSGGHALLLGPGQQPDRRGVVDQRRVHVRTAARAVEDHHVVTGPSGLGQAGVERGLAVRGGDVADQDSHRGESSRCDWSAVVVGAVRRRRTAWIAGNSTTRRKHARTVPEIGLVANWVGSPSKISRLRRTLSSRIAPSTNASTIGPGSKPVFFIR